MFDYVISVLRDYHLQEVAILIGDLTRLEVDVTKDEEG